MRGSWRNRRKRERMEKVALAVRLSPLLLPDNHSDSCWWLADSPPTARNAIVFTINTPCLLARRGAAHYVVGAHYAVNCGRRLGDRSRGRGKRPETKPTERQGAEFLRLKNKITAGLRWFSTFWLRWSFCHNMTPPFEMSVFN